MPRLFRNPPENSRFAGCVPASSGTFNGKTPFAGIQPNRRRFTTTVMNFYTFDLGGKICKDVAATGIAGILQGIGAIP